MSSAANLDANTLGVPPADPDQHHQASLTLAANARDADELLEWLGMFGLPPCDRPPRSYVPGRVKGGGK